MDFISRLMKSSSEVEGLIGSYCGTEAYFKGERDSQVERLKSGGLDLTLECNQQWKRELGGADIRTYLDQMRGLSFEGADFVDAGKLLERVRGWGWPEGEIVVLRDYINQSESLATPKAIRGQEWAEICWQNIEYSFFQQMLRLWDSPDILCQWEIIYKAVNHIPSELPGNRCHLTREALRHAWRALELFTQWKGWKMLPDGVVFHEFLWMERKSIRERRLRRGMNFRSGAASIFLSGVNGPRLLWIPGNEPGAMTSAFSWDGPPSLLKSPRNVEFLARVAVATGGQFVFDGQSNRKWSWLFDAVKGTNTWKDAVTKWGGTLLD